MISNTFNNNHIFLFIPNSGMKWVRITDVKENQTIFSKICRNNLRARWVTGATQNDPAYFIINTSPVVATMSYLSWCVKNAWVWGPGGSCKAFLTRSRRFILVLAIASYISVITVIAPSFRAIDVIDGFIPQVHLINLGAIPFTTDTIIQAAVNSLAAFVVVVFNEAILRCLMPVLECCCCCKDQGKDSDGVDPKKSIDHDMVVIDIEEEINDCKNICSCKCCVTYTLSSTVYFLIATCIIGSLGFVVIVLDGVCYQTLLHFVLSTIVGLFMHAFVFDPLKAAFVTIRKMVRKDDMPIV